MVCSSGSMEEHTSQIDRFGSVDRITRLPSVTSTTTSYKLETQSKKYELQQWIRRAKKVRILCIKKQHGMVLYIENGLSCDKEKIDNL